MASGAQNWFDVWALEGFLRVAEPLLAQTLLPVLRATAGDSPQIDQEYSRLVEERISTRWTAPRRDRARARLSNFVSELNWVCAELRQLLHPAQYEALVTATTACLLESRLGEWLPRIARLLAGAPADTSGTSSDLGLAARLVGGPLGPGLLGRVQPLSFLVGEVDVDEWVPERGRATFYIPRCELRAARGDGERADEACSRVCKGGVETVCGPRSPLRVELAPARNGSCQMRVQWDDLAGRRRAAGAEQPLVQLGARAARRSVDAVWN